MCLTFKVGNSEIYCFASISIQVRKYLNGTTFGFLVTNLTGHTTTYIEFIGFLYNLIYLFMS